MEKLASISIDMDSLACYAAIHGLPVPGNIEPDPIFKIAMPRIFDFLGSIRATLFIVGNDLSHAATHAMAYEAHRQGHELASHSHTHPYDLIRQPRGSIMEELERSRRAIEAVSGQPPCGFRSPGYTTSDELLQCVREAGYLYDSSVFSCPLYWLAKRFLIRWKTLRGYPSRSIADTWHVLAAPTAPYRVGRPYWKPGDGTGLLELPIGVTGTTSAQMPMIGTMFTLIASRFGLKALQLYTRLATSQPVVNIELHAIDFLDRQDGLQHLQNVQPDVRIPHTKKVKALHTVIRTLSHHGYRFVRMDEMAKTYVA